jgi:hypothetical protein
LKTGKWDALGALAKLPKRKKYEKKERTFKAID